MGAAEECGPFSTLLSRASHCGQEDDGDYAKRQRQLLHDPLLLLLLPVHFGGGGHLCNILQRAVATGGARQAPRAR